MNTFKSNAEGFLQFVLLLAMAAAGSIQAADGTFPEIPAALQPLVASETIETRPDGAIVRSTAFTDPIPLELYLSAYGAEDLVGQDFAIVGTECIPPDQDFDGDGFVGADDAFPTKKGPYIADSPRLTAVFSAIEPGLRWHDEILQEEQTTAKEMDKNRLQETRTTTQLREFKRHWNSKTSLYGMMQFQNFIKPVFKFKLENSSSFEYDQQNNHRWERQYIEAFEHDYELIRQRVDKSTASLGPNDGFVSGLVTIQNQSDYAMNIDVTYIKVVVIAYSPATGAIRVVGDWDEMSAFSVGFGSGNSSDLFHYEIPKSALLPGVNTRKMLHMLADGWVFDTVMGAFSATKQSTGEPIETRISTINGRNARIMVHFGELKNEQGDYIGKQLGKLAVYQPDNSCLTAKDMLMSFVGGDATFKYLPDGSLVVECIEGICNRHNDIPFEEMTEVQQQEYGRWLVGYEYYEFGPNGNNLDLDLESTFLTPEDKVYFYYLAGTELFRDDSIPPDITQSFSVANDGSEPAQVALTQDINVDDYLELTVGSTIETHESFTTTTSNVIRVCEHQQLYSEQTYHDHRPDAGGAVPVNNPDFYGVEFEFNNSGNWLTMSDIMSDPGSRGEIVEWDTYPAYSFKLRFRVTFDMTGDLPVVPVKIRNNRPRDQFLVGWTGRNIVGTYYDCRTWEPGGFMRNDIEIVQWHDIDETDFDEDGVHGYNEILEAGNDFDDNNMRKFPFAPDVLDGQDNDGDGAVDNAPLLCPTSLIGGESGTCGLRDPFGWYEAPPVTSVERRWIYQDGSNSGWEDAGPLPVVVTMSPESDTQALEVKTTSYPSGGGTLVGTNRIAHVLGGQTPGAITFEDFDDGVADGFVNHNGTWTVVDGALNGTGPGSEGNDSVSVVASTEPAAALAFDFRVLNSDGSYNPYFGAILRYVDVNHWLRLDMYRYSSSSSTTYVRLIGRNGGTTIYQVATLPGVRFDDGVLHHLRVEDAGCHARVFVDAELVFETDYESSLAQTHRGMLVNTGSTVRFDNFLIYEMDDDQDDDGWRACGGDCDDNNPAVRPGASEICDNDDDENCNGLLDDGCVTGPGNCIKGVCIHETP